MSFADGLNANFGKGLSKGKPDYSSSAKMQIDAIRRVCHYASFKGHSAEGYFAYGSYDGELGVLPNKEQIKKSFLSVDKDRNERTSRSIMRTAGEFCPVVIREARTLGFKTFEFKVVPLHVSFFETYNVYYFKATW